MKNTMMKLRAASVAAAAMMTVSAAVGTMNSFTGISIGTSVINAYAAESSVKVLSSAGFGEGMYATWTAATSSRN